MKTQDVDLNNLELTDEQELEEFVPPDDGTYTVILKLQDGKKVQMGNGKRGAFFLIPVQANIMEPGSKFDKRVLFHSAFAGSQAQIIKAAGDKPSKFPSERAKQTLAILQSEPIVKVTTRWRAQYKDIDAEGKVVYKEIFAGQRMFPELVDEPGVRQYIVETPFGEEVSAQAEILKFAKV